MQYTTIPGIEVKASRVALGCMSTVPSQTYAGLDDTDAAKTIREAFDQGVTLFDTARAYADGESERQLGRAVTGFRDNIIIASKPKAGDLSEAEITSECEQSLRDLGTDRIDLYQIHWPKRKVPLEETVRTMERLVEQGKIRTIGVCNFGPEDMKEWLNLGPCVTNQIAYSMIARGAEFGLEELCTDNKVGLLCYSPLAQGLLAGVYATADDVPSGRARTRHFSTDRPEARHGQPGFEAQTFAALARIRTVAERLDRPMGEVALAWLLAKPSITAVLAGASRPDQVARNTRAADLKLSAADVAELDAATNEVKELMGPSIDMWEHPGRTR